MGLQIICKGKVDGATVISCNISQGHLLGKRPPKKDSYPRGAQPMMGIGRGESKFSTNYTKIAHFCKNGEKCYRFCSHFRGEEGRRGIDNFGLGESIGAEKPT